MMGGRIRIGTGRTARVRAVSRSACRNQRDIQADYKDAAGDHSEKATYMPGGYFRRSHDVPAVVEHADALRQLRVPHEHHVADVGGRCREAGMFLEKLYWLTRDEIGLVFPPG